MDGKEDVNLFIFYIGTLLSMLSGHLNRTTVLVSPTVRGAPDTQPGSIKTECS